MTTQPEQDRLHHLLDRARRGVILPAEGEALATLVAELEKRARQTEELLSIAHETSNRSEAERARMEQRVAELTAGQCTHALAVCEQHHRVPVTGCPYPRCKAAAARTT
ncbi:hypothetical protein ACFWXI_14575 [[Kitasatospora] papulosa]|uniref:hypothetical protein n=1 Tax=[Kitasatospora] papulosa TaxID=1464011 RepID=UPI0036C364F1